MHRKPSSLSSLFILVLGFGFIGLGMLSLREKKALDSDGVTAEARLTGARTQINKGQKSFQVQYAFTPTADAPEVSPGDFLGRSNLWFTLPEEEFEKVRSSEKLKIRYDPSTPRNSRPLAAPPESGDIWTLVGLGILLMIIGIVGIIRK